MKSVIAILRENLNYDLENDAIKNVNTANT